MGIVVTGYIGPIRFQDLRGGGGVVRLVDDPIDWRVPRLTAEELTRFALDVIEDRIFLAQHVQSQDPDVMRSVFPVDEFYKSISPEARREIGTFYQYRAQAAGRTRHGYPHFSSVRFLHREDWERARDLIAAEVLRRERHPQ